MVKAAGSLYLTREEVVARLAALTEADAVRIERAAAIYARGSRFSPRDLVQDAYVSALERRNWRHDLSAVVFLIGAIRSLAHSQRKSTKVSALDQALAKGGGEAALADLVADADGPADIAESEQALERFVSVLEQCFAGDHQVMRVVKGRAAGETASEIRQSLGLDQSQYETVCRRLLRGYQTRMKMEG